jgi:16S rRNA (adenine1518-N6/adenine1519-N6)-dimethyltransferase
MAILRAFFSSRRKTVKNNFSAWLTASGKLEDGENADDLTRTYLTAAGIDAATRAETLSVQDFQRLTDILFATGRY